MSNPACRHDGPVSIVPLSDSTRSKLTIADLARLADAIETADRDPNTSVIVMAGPPGTFCAGGDLADFLACADLSELTAVARCFLLALAHAEKPLIAAVDGPAIGLGMTMLLQFDVVVATPESRFMAPFADLGLVPEAGSTLLAPARFGHLRAFELLCLGKTMTAEEAHAIGLVSEVAPSGQALERAHVLALKLARKPSDALRATKRLLRGDRDAIGSRIDVELACFRAALEDATTARRLTRLSQRYSRKVAA